MIFQLSRLQGNSEQNTQYSKSYPNSATNTAENVGRKTWSAPKKDPFGLSENQVHTMERPARKHRSTEELDDPLQRKAPHKTIIQDGYQPSFGLDGGSRVMNNKKYMKELEEQMADQKRRKAKEDKERETDWWEKRKPLVPEFKAPHPNQVSVTYSF